MKKTAIMLVALGLLVLVGAAWWLLQSEEGKAPLSGATALEQTASSRSSDGSLPGEGPPGGDTPAGQAGGGGPSLASSSGPDASGGTGAGGGGPRGRAVDAGGKKEADKGDPALNKIHVSSPIQRADVARGARPPVQGETDASGEPINTGGTLRKNGDGWSLAGTRSHDHLTGTGQVDTITAGNGDDTVTGGEGDDWIDGEQGDDVLDGGPGDDSLEGGDGDNVLMGGAGNDYLVANHGIDVLRGGPGADTLTGGGDSDIFLYSTGDADGQVDTIEDFSVSEHDILDVSDLLSEGGYTGDGSPASLDGYVRFTGSILEIDPDGGGDRFIPLANTGAPQDFQALVQGGLLKVKP